MAHFGTDLPGNGWAGHNSSTIEEVAVGDLIIDPGVSWKQKVEDVERALPFVKRYARDHFVPAMIDGDNCIIEGTAIAEATKKAGIKRPRVVRQVFTDVAERKLFSIASAKILSTSIWDGDALTKVVLEFEKSIENFSHNHRANGCRRL